MFKQIIERFDEQGCKIFYVGGYVRDKILGINNKDIDVEIYFPKNINPEEKIVEILSEFGQVDLIGKHFGIYKLHGLDVDFCLPRTETKNNLKGHKGFDVEINGHLDTYMASIRRDLTINSLLQDCVTGDIIDHFGGVNDISNKIIKIVNEKTFIEDPLRVLRIAQFKARFDFSVDKETIKLCKQIVNSGEMETLPKERIFEEFNKMLMKSNKPSIGMNFLREIGYLPKELKDLIGCIQRLDMHPEGDVWNHTMLVLDKMASLRNLLDNPLAIMYSALCHDMGKPLVTDTEGKSIGHEKAGIEVARTFLNKFTNDSNIHKIVLSIVENHMKPIQLYSQKSKNSSIIRLKKKIEGICTFKDLILFSQADFEGRGGYNDFSPIKEWFEEKDTKIGYHAPKPIVTGDDIIKLGFSPSPIFKEILSFAYELQIEDENTKKEFIIEKIKEKFIK